MFQPPTLPLFCRRITHSLADFAFLIFLDWLWVCISFLLEVESWMKCHGKSADAYFAELAEHRKLGQEQLSAMVDNKKIRWGIAGCGRISNDFVAALTTLPAGEHEVWFILGNQALIRSINQSLNQSSWSGWLYPFIWLIDWLIDWSIDWMGWVLF